MRSLAVSLLLTAALFSGVVMGVMLVTRLAEPAVPPDDADAPDAPRRAGAGLEQRGPQGSAARGGPAGAAEFLRASAPPDDRRVPAAGRPGRHGDLRALVRFARAEDAAPHAAGRARGRGPLARRAAAEHHRRGRRQRRRSRRTADLRTRRRPADSAGALRRTGRAASRRAVRRDDTAPRAPSRRTGRDSAVPTATASSRPTTGRRNGTPRPARTSSGKPRSRCPATARPCSGATGCSSRARTPTRRKPSASRAPPASCSGRRRSSRRAAR